MTIQSIAHRLRLPHEYTRAIVRALDGGGVVSVETGFNSVRVTLVDGYGGGNIDNADDTDDDDYDSADGYAGVRPDGGATQLSETTSMTIDDLEISDVFFLLRSERRRLLIELLSNIMAAVEEDALDTPDPDGYHPVYVEVSEVALRVEAARKGTPVEALTQTERRRGYISFTQQHCHTLHEHTVVEYFERPQKLAARPVVNDLAVIIDQVRERTNCDSQPGVLEWEP